MPADHHASAERHAFAAISIVALAPVIAHGAWRPLATRLAADASAVSMTAAAMTVAAVASLVQWLSRESPRGARMAGTVAVGVAVAAGVALGARTGAATIGATTLCLLAVAAFSAGLGPWIVRRLPRELDGLARRRKVTAALVIAAGALTVVQTARLSSFIGDPQRTGLSVIPSVPFLVNHSCLTAYVHGARLATEGEPNVYDAQHWPDLGGSPRARAYQAADYAPFALDAYAYPPPFLLLPRFLLQPLGDFRSQRSVWFACNAIVLAIGLWAVAAWVGGRARVRALMLAPFVWISLPTLLILQIGNVHATVIVIAMLAMVAFETERPALGGALLAFAILSKLSPGLLVIVLLQQRRYRAVLMTAGFGVAFLLAALLVFGVAPFDAFLRYQLPRLGSGEALRFLAQPESFPINVAPFGLPFKLAHLGVPIADPWRTAKAINLLFSLAIVVLTVIGARRSDSPRSRAILWLTVLMLGALRSPFAPGYVIIAALWLFSLWADEVRGVVAAVALGVAWLVVSTTPPLSLTQIVIITLVQQTLLVALLAYLAVRKQTVAADVAESRP